MVNKTKKIIALFIGFIFLFQFAPLWHIVLADEEPEPEAIETCLEKYPDFKKEDDAPYRPFELPEEKLDHISKFRSAFYQAQDQYHLFAQCIFDEAAKEILAADTGTDGFWSANTPNIPHLSEPDVACLSPDKLVGTANNTGSSALMPTLLRAYNAYSAHLTRLQAKYETDVVLKVPLDELAKKRVRRAKQLVKNELQDSVVALHSAFNQLMELRQVFIMHVHFQCMLHNLEKYRHLLGELRKVVELLPARIIDASASK